MNISGQNGISQTAPNESGTILVVDDLPENAIILRHFLQPAHFRVDAVKSGEEALEYIAKTPPDVILLDLVMPGMSGFDVCRYLKNNPATRHIPVIIITGMADREANIRAVEAGADDFLLKPFDRVLLMARINTSLRTKKLQDALLSYKQQLEQRVQERTREVEKTREVAVFSLARLAESRDTETGDHLDRMRRYVRLLGVEMRNWKRYEEFSNPRYVDELYLSSPLHDIGKVGIPDKILLKPGKLTPQEFDIMKTHTLIGGDTLRDADEEAETHSFLAIGRDIAYFHHERWDGSGYPYGLKGTDIPLCARIVALADVYDALSSRRPYKEPFSHEKSKDIILESAGSHFDPDVVQAFLNVEDGFIEIRERFGFTGRVSILQQLASAIEVI